MAICEVCFRHCDLTEGQTGFCGARICARGVVRAGNYGRLTSLALDPIEKKPLKRFMPGSRILSVGSYGCNLRCPFCQNYEISWSGEAMRYAQSAQFATPEQIAKTALYYRDKGNVGVAFTYNEPLVGYEFVRDTAKLVHEAGMVNALVSNGTAELAVLEEILPYMDAMNIDLKGFTDRYYRDVLGGDRGMVMRFIERAVKSCHVELTTLIIPGENDSEEEMRNMCEWIAGLTGKSPGREIPLHISRFFPRFHMTDRNATDVKKVYRLAEVAREKLKFVYTGNC
ncbi:MAG: AmmeMemoRadiSam system radical SAM enzyme [Lachnospiraceae bacterium]|nr:AmmeMemoRadiSam system radical SAM enzyme [Lachnospiraceae bacterium]